MKRRGSRNSNSDGATWRDRNVGALCDRPLDRRLRESLRRIRSGRCNLAGNVHAPPQHRGVIMRDTPSCDGRWKLTLAEVTPRPMRYI